MSNTTRRIVIIVAAVVFVFSASKIISYYYQLQAGKTTYDSIREEAVTEPEIVEEVEEAADILPYIDFDALNKINPDIIAWLYIPDTPISYPVLRGPNNQAYLRTTYEKKPNILGSIFQDYRNDADFQDPNTIVYGHNTKNDSMFGSLKKYKQLDYAEHHKNVYIIRKDDTLAYEAFSVFETLATSDTYTIRFANDDSFKSYLADTAAKTLVPVGLPPDSGDIVTLSTCTGGNKSMRLVLQARLVKSLPTESAPAESAI